MTSLQYAQELVRFESTSVLSNVAVTDHVESVLRSLGFDTERVDYDDEHGVRKANVIGKKGPGTGGMAYFGHTDVVPAKPWLFPDHGPFVPTIKEGRLYGRGSCDMKGSVACMLAAAAAVSAGQLRKPVYITCTADEEIGFAGAENVARRSQLFREMVAGQSHGVIGEPTLLEVVHAHKGIYGFVATSRGIAAHSSSKRGRNANLAMIPFLAEMKAIHDELETELFWRHGEFDPPTMCWNIGINDHTSAVNITAPQSVCTVYFRPMPGQDVEPLLQRAEAAAKKHGLDFEVRCRGLPVYVDPNSEFVQDVLKIAGQPAARTVAYGTDGGMFHELSQLVVLGPGSIAQAHTHDEWIDLSQLEQGTALYSRLIEHWCF